MTRLLVVCATGSLSLKVSGTQMSTLIPVHTKLSEPSKHAFTYRHTRWGPLHQQRLRNTHTVIMLPVHQRTLFGPPGAFCAAHAGCCTWLLAQSAQRRSWNPCARCCNLALLVLPPTPGEGSSKRSQHSGSNSTSRQGSSRSNKSRNGTPSSSSSRGAMIRCP